MKPKNEIKSRSKFFLVTGATGYIGSHMCYALKQKYPNCVVIAVDKVYKDKLNRLFDEFILEDLSVSHLDVFERYGIDCIFHFAAYASVPEGERESWEYYRNNIKSSINLIEAATKYGVQNFVFSSTCSVYGPSQKGFISEDTPKNPVSVYAKTKSIVEDILLSAPIRSGILRYFNVAGRNVIADLYEEHEPETHLIPLLMRSDIANMYGTDFDTKDGTAVRDYVHVEDVCDAHIAAYEFMNEKDENIICNIGTGIGYSVKEIINVVQGVTGRQINIIECKRRDGDVDHLVSNIERMQTLLNFTPKHDIVSIVGSMNKEIKSPCSKVCYYENVEKKVCAGCGRTADEITEWSTATQKRKKEIVKAAKKRRKP